MHRECIKELEGLVRERSRRRGLNTDLARLRYTNNYIYSGIGNQRDGRVLYVGIGHGHDAVLAMMDGLVGNIVGVDPFRAKDGGLRPEYEELISLVKRCGLEDRFSVERLGIDEYIKNCRERFDAIICGDVLHHIFISEKSLSKSKVFDNAVSIFSGLAGLVRKQGFVAIGEVDRIGLRPLIANLLLALGIKHKFSKKYRAKQVRGQWARAAVRGGWSLLYYKNYVPWRLRKQRWLWSGMFGRLTLCDRYFIFLRRG